MSKTSMEKIKFSETLKYISKKIYNIYKSEEKKYQKDGKSPQIDLHIQSNHNPSLSQFGGHGNLASLLFKVYLF